MKTHNAWPTRRFDMMNRDAIDTRCTGDCNQGRLCKCAPSPAECCTELGADAATEWESADAAVLLFMLKLLGGILGFCFLAWAAA